MRIGLFSDLHTEFDNGIQWTPPTLDADIIVFAGDNVTSPAQLRIFAEAVEQRQRTASHLLYVCGNHEFYGSRSRFGKLGYEKYRAALNNLPRSYLLEMDTIDVRGFRIIGATMWTPVRPAIAPTFNDYRYIRIDVPPYRRLRPIDVFERHHRTVAFLENVLDRAAPTVVITHHPPSRIGLNVEPNDPWAADLDSLIFDRQPLAWLHGHVHQSHADLIGNTKIVSNPRGYFPSALNARFDPHYTVEV